VTIEKRMTDFFIGKWRKGDGLTFTVTDQSIHLYQSYTQKFSFPRLDLIAFNWDDLNQTWGPVEFSKIDDNTICESGTNERFYRTPPHPLRDGLPPLTLQQIETFLSEGFLILRDAVHEDYVKEARRAILSEIGTVGIPQEMIPQYKSQTWVPRLRKDPAAVQPLVEIFRHSALVPALESLLKAPSSYLSERYPPQVALVFPKLDGPRSFGEGAHIDGIPTPNNGLATGRMHGFSSLIGIALSDQMEEFCGNLVVYPGLLAPPFHRC
jgi:hypothetical protein